MGTLAEYRNIRLVSHRTTSEEQFLQASFGGPLVGTAPFVTEFRKVPHRWLDLTLHEARTNGFLRVPRSTVLLPISTVT